MGEQVLSARVSVDKIKSEYIDGRRISLPVFSSDSGKDIPNYLRASIGSCHDYCKFGKETVSVRQNRPWIKKTAAASQVVFPTVKSAKIARKNASNEKRLEKVKSNITSEVKESEYSVKSMDEDMDHSAGFPTISGSKLLKEESLVKITGATSGSKKLEKLKRVVPAKVGSRVGGRKSLILSENKSNVSMVNRSSAVKKHDAVTKSPMYPPKKLNAIARPPLSSSSSKLAIKGKTPSSTLPPVTAIAKSKPLPSPNQLKGKSAVAHAPSSSATKNNASTLKAPPPPVYPRNASTKKIFNLKDQNAKKGNASKTRVTKALATRCGSIPHKSNTTTNLKRKGLRPGKSVDVKLAETKEFHEKKEEVPSHAAESGNHEEMESYDEVPEKTLYVIEMETGNNTKAPSRDEVQTHYSMTSQTEVVHCELTNTDISPPSAEEIPDNQTFTPSSSFSCTTSNTQDDSANTESEVDYIIHEDARIVHGGNLKDAEKAKLKKSAAIPSEDYSKDPVKLAFRRGTVIDTTLENNAPRRLKFRREHVVQENIASSDVRESRFKMTEATQDNGTRKNNSGTVVLRHQDMQGKKNAKVLFNNVIEETASRLVETRKSKVKALVGAFETVISLQDGKPAAATS